MFSSFFLEQLNTALNRYLALDPESSQRLQDLEGRSFGLALEGLALQLQLTILQNQVHITTDNRLPPEVTIRGTPLSLFHLALSRDKKNFIRNAAVTIEGNAELAQQLMELVEALEIDWEEQLSHWVGDLPAHSFGRLTKKFFAWGREAKESLAQNLNDYIHEEKPYFPPTAALEDFYNAVDELRLDLDRLEARIHRLQKDDAT